MYSYMYTVLQLLILTVVGYIIYFSHTIYKQYQMNTNKQNKLHARITELTNVYHTLQQHQSRLHAHNGIYWFVVVCCI